MVIVDFCWHCAEQHWHVGAATSSGPGYAPSRPLDHVWLQGWTFQVLMVIEEIEEYTDREKTSGVAAGTVRANVWNVSAAISSGPVWRTRLRSLRAPPGPVWLQEICSGPGRGSSMPLVQGVSRDSSPDAIRGAPWSFA